MILEEIEFETIWRVAHKWSNKDPDLNNLDAVNPIVEERLQRICRAITHSKISARKSNNMPVLDNWLVVNMIFEYKLFWPLRDTYYYKKIDKKLLNSLFISRAEILKWCSDEYLAPPQFWLKDNQFSKVPEKTKESPASKIAKAKASCRAFAQLLWMIDPKIHPKHIAESKALKQLENMKGYQPETVRDWIIDLDPQTKFRKMGAPPKVTYKIDLETGVINEKAFPSYIEK